MFSELPKSPSRSPTPPTIFDDLNGDNSSWTRASTPDPRKNFRDLPESLRRRIWELQIEPRVVEMYPCRLKKTKLELFQERIMDRPGELPQYTFEKIGPLVRERCHALRQTFTKDNCEPEHLKEIEGLHSLVNKAIQFLMNAADMNPNQLFDLRTIISTFLKVKIPIDYVPSLLGWTTLELITFLRLTFTEEQLESFPFKYQGSGEVGISEQEFEQLNQSVWAFKTDSPIPNVLLVCRESYDIAMRYYDRTFKPYQTAPGTYFAFQKDTLLFRSDKLDEGPYPEWVYDQAWPQAYGHFERTLRACHDYENLAMRLENVSVVMHPALKTLYHGYCNTLCLGKVHEMFMSLKKCTLLHAQFTKTDDGSQESIFLPLLDCEQAWKSYNNLTPTRWQFTRKPDFEVYTTPHDFPQEFEVLENEDDGIVAAVWNEKKDPGLFRLFRFFDDIDATRKIGARCQKVILHTKWQAEQKAKKCGILNPALPVVVKPEHMSTPKIVLHTKWKAEQRVEKCLATSGPASGASSTNPPVTLEAESVSTPKIVLNTKWKAEQMAEECLSKSGSGPGTSSSDVVGFESMSTPKIVLNTKWKAEQKVKECLAKSRFRASIPHRPAAVKAKSLPRILKPGNHGSSARSRSCGEARVSEKSKRSKVCISSIEGDVEMGSVC